VFREEQIQELEIAQSINVLWDKDGLLLLQDSNLWLKGKEAAMHLL